MNTDLNLLRLFGVLMEVRSVSRAAARLNLTQSAISHALGRLRAQLGDPLFVRTHGGLRPTERALAIAPAIRDGLDLLREATAPTIFDPATTTRLFTISASSYFCVTLLPIFIERARAQAPLARFRIMPPPEELLPIFAEGGLDLALGSFGVHASQLVKTMLLLERFVWIGRAGSDTHDLAARPRLAVARAAIAPVSSDMAMRGGIEQRIGIVPSPSATGEPGPVTVYDPLSAGALIAESDLICLWPLQLARRVTSNAGVAVLAAADQPEIELSMLWPARRAADPAHLWLRTRMTEAAAALVGQDAARHRNKRTERSYPKQTPARAKKKQGDAGGATL